MKRRGFLLTLAAAGIAARGTGHAAEAGLPPGELLGAAHGIGHLLRQPVLPAPDETRRVPLLIVGAGIGGLSAAWKLARAGFRDYLIVELETAAGGNSRSGHNDVSAYPWGAHYLPLPTLESRAVRELLADLGVLLGDPLARRPRYDERYLCHAPHERLYRNGLWEEGLLPRLGLPRAERAQQQRFRDRMAQLRARRDRAGRKAFAIPMEYSSRDPDLLALDRVSMRDWLLGQGFDAPSLHWYVNYACRDDYGTDYAETSAWAGIHYFACRDAEAEDAAGDTVLTRPEGNGWIVGRLVERQGGRLLAGAAVFRIEVRDRDVAADVFLHGAGRTLRIVARQAIWAAPLFLLPAVGAGLGDGLRAALGGLEYAPWVVANLTLDAPLQERAGVPAAWDNVLYDSPGLGYVVATHQNIRLRPGPTVLTYYRALSDRPPRAAREELLAAPREVWARSILDDLARPHPDIRARTRRIDVFRHGHAMVRPRPGTIWGAARSQLPQGAGRLQFAHADVSGLSLFEEANYRGVLAAERALRRLGVGFDSSLA
jgi:monoamine oxidase